LREEGLAGAGLAEEGLAGLAELMDLVGATDFVCPTGFVGLALRAAATGAARRDATVGLADLADLVRPRGLFTRPV
jgi:hypothetical protein